MKRSDCILTINKHFFSPLAPTPENICIEDIAHALSYMCRANGHFKSFFSVAQHSLNCALEGKARGYTKKQQLACLLHDASEAYLSDITRPVKHHLTNYLEIERNLQNVIWSKFGLELSEDDLKLISAADDCMLYYEFAVLADAKLFDNPPEIKSQPDFSQRDFTSVKQDFLDLYRSLV